MNVEAVDEMIGDIPAVVAFHTERPRSREARWGEARTGFVFAGELPFAPQPGVLDARAFVATVLRSIVALDPRAQLIAGELGRLRVEVAEIKALIADRPIVRQAFLMTLGARPFQLTRAIPIVLEEYEDETLARWPEVQATGRGATEALAIESLRSDIEYLYGDLSQSSTEELTDELQSVLAILRSVLKS